MTLTIYKAEDLTHFVRKGKRKKVSEKIDSKIQETIPLSDMIKIVTMGSKKPFDNNIFKIVISKRNELYKRTGHIYSIKDIIEMAIKKGIDSVK
jgi:hypothetical protein